MTACSTAKRRARSGCSDSALGCNFPYTVTRIDNKTNLSGIGSSGDLASVYWHIECDRPEIGNVRLTFTYLDAQVAGLDEDRLILYHGESESGAMGPPAQPLPDRSGPQHDQ